MQSSSILSLDLEMFVDLVKVDNNPTKIPYNFKDVFRFASQFLEQRNDVCQSITGTSCKAIDEHLIIHNEKDESPSEILMICRNLEYGSRQFKLLMVKVWRYVKSGQKIRLEISFNISPKSLDVQLNRSRSVKN